MSTQHTKLSGWRLWFSLISPRQVVLLGSSYLFGFVLGAGSWSRVQLPIFWVLLVAFSIFGTIFFQALNSLGDAQISRQLSTTTRVRLLGIVLIISGFYLFLFFVMTSFSQLIMASYLLLSALYFLPPTRLKDRPFLASYSQVLYLVPGLIGYWLGSYAFPSFFVMLAAALWLAAEDALNQLGRNSATSHRQELLTLLGESSTLLFIFCNWLAAAVLIQGNGWIFFGAFLYPALGLLYMLSSKGTVHRSRWLSRLLNAIAFFGLLITALLQK